MPSYRLDGVLLSPEEDARHRGAYNVAILNTAHDGSTADLVRAAFDMADATIREFRQRINPTAPPPPPPVRYRLASDESIIRAWHAASLRTWTTRNNAVIEALRKTEGALYPHQIADLTPAASGDMVKQLRDAGVLVAVEEEGGDDEAS